MPSPTSIRMVGLHHYVPSKAVFRETLNAYYGSGLRGSERADAMSWVQEHFDGLYIIEIEVEPSTDGLDWSEITQPTAGSPRSNWQAPYSERSVDAAQKRWAFFFHFLDLKQPLQAPCGPVPLPPVTPLPVHLKRMRYFAP